MTRITIRNVRESLNDVGSLLDRFYLKTLNSFTSGDAKFISKAIFIIIKHYYYENRPLNNKLQSINIDAIETDSDDSSYCINLQEDISSTDTSIDIDKLQSILNRISIVGNARDLYSLFISLINGHIKRYIKCLLLIPIANCLNRIEYRRSPLIANILASLHNIINEGITLDEVDRYILFIDLLWNEPISDDLHGVANSCLKSFSIQLNEKLFYKIYGENELEFVPGAGRLSQRYIKNEGDILDWFISLKTIPNSSFRGPLETSGIQESLMSFIMLDCSYLNMESDLVILPLIYSHKARGTMAMHSALSLIKSCGNLKNLLYKRCILKLITWALIEFRVFGYRITSLKGTCWQPIEICDALLLMGENELVSGINGMVTIQAQ